MKRPIITNEELAEQGVSRELFGIWYDLTNSIWQKLISFNGKIKVQKGDENTILITHHGIKLSIYCTFVNGEYVNANVKVGDNESLEVRHYGDLTATTLAVAVFVHQFLSKH